MNTTGVNRRPEEVPMERLARTGGPVARGQHPLHDGSGVRPPDFLPVRRRPHGGAPRQIPALRLGQPPPPQQRPPDLQQGPRLPAALRDVQGGRRHHRRRAAEPAQVRQPLAGPSQPARPALRRRRDRLARPGAAHRRRHGPERQVPRQAPLSHLGPARRQRDGRRLELGGVRQGVVLQARPPDRHPGHEPPRPARRDRPRLEQRRLRRARPRLRLARHRAGRP